MNRQLVAVVLLVVALLPWAPLEAGGGYRLHPGDLIDISVWGEENLRAQTRVLPDGSISFPLAGRINVKGKTSTQVERALSGRLKKYIPDAQVSVVVRSPDGNRVFVLGKVTRPGAVVMMTSTMTVTQALSMAGGLTRFAKENKIKILRMTGEGQIQGFIRYKDIMSGKDLTTNYQLRPGDTIVVP